MPRFLQPLLLLLARLTDRELAKVVQFLKEENEILRSRLTKRVMLTPMERRRLHQVRPATRFGHQGPDPDRLAGDIRPMAPPGRVSEIAALRLANVYVGAGRPHLWVGPEGAKGEEGPRSSVVVGRIDA